MTVEDVEAVAAHLCSHHQILGDVGSSIGPGERAQRSRCRVHTCDGRVSRSQSQVRHVLATIAAVHMLVVLKRPRTGAGDGCGLAPVAVRPTCRQLRLLNPATACCQLGLQWGDAASFSHPEPVLEVWNAAEP